MMIRRCAKGAAGVACAGVGAVVGQRWLEPEGQRRPASDPFNAVADRASGACVGGLVYRPLCPSRTWAVGCKAEGLAESSLNAWPEI